LAATATDLQAEGVEVRTAVFDARDADALTDCIESIDDAEGRLDVLVNVVGGTFNQPFEHTSAKGWDALTRTNFTWLLTSTQLAIPRLRAAGGGSIINVSSIEGVRAAPGYSVYAGLKGAVVNFGRSLAVEVAADGIRVNTIAPDLIPTEGMVPLTAGGAADPDALAGAMGGDAIAITIPMGRVGTYDDFGGCVLFLASNLSRFVTGTTLHPDGGTWASAGWFNWPGTGWRNTVPPDVAAKLEG
jgi:NAD(P)-dependent dehydrogenase (short-subunit alcohol dehydrogenase family)